ncbi:MAG: ABC transporter permease [Verrucomicrobiales bacterium]
MKRILGIFVLLLVVFLATWIFSDLATGRSGFMSAFNQGNLLRRTSLAAILAIGVAFVIITGGIDLSIGSVVCLVGAALPYMLITMGWPLWMALVCCLGLSLLIGLWHGFLITKVNLQPFIVTLCGLLIYRGVTRGITRDQNVGFDGQFQELKWIVSGKLPVFGFDIPISFFVLIVVAVIAGIFLNKTIYGRYLLAMGNNEEAAKFSGINTTRMKVIAYVISAMLAGFGGVLYIIDNQSAQPVDFGNFYELYAIAAAVLGGCSLRGGTGSILGVIIGAALMQVLKNMITQVDWMNDNIEFAIVGSVILAGAIGDEVAKKIGAKKRAAVAGDVKSTETA